MTDITPSPRPGGYTAPKRRRKLMRMLSAQWGMYARLLHGLGAKAQADDVATRDMYRPVRDIAIRAAHRDGMQVMYIAEYVNLTPGHVSVIIHGRKM